MSVFEKDVCIYRRRPVYDNIKDCISNVNVKNAFHVKDNIKTCSIPFIGKQVVLTPEFSILCEGDANKL